MLLKIFNNHFLYPAWSELTLFGKCLMAIDIMAVYVVITIDYLWLSSTAWFSSHIFHVFKIYKEEQRP